MNYFETNPSITDVLKELNPKALTLEQKYLLFMLPDREFSCFPDLKSEKYIAIKKIEKDFTKDLISFQNDQRESQDKILKILEFLQKLDFTENLNQKIQLLDNLKSEILKIDINSANDMFIKIEEALGKLSNLTSENYVMAKGLCEIFDLQNKYHLEPALNIQSLTLSLKESMQIVEIENQKQDSLFNIKNELCIFKYALSFNFNEELLFIAAFIDPTFLENNAPELFKILNKRTRLYRKIRREVEKYTNFNIIQFTHLFLSVCELNDSSLLYFRLRKLIHAYLFLCSKDPSFPEIYPKLEAHLKNILVISSETDLLNPEINRMYSNNFSKMLDQLGITQKDVAKILGITTSALSQEMNKPRPSQKYLLKLAKLYNCSLSFLQEKTTIPAYGKLTNDQSAIYLLHIAVRRNVGENFLDILHDVFTQDREDTYSIYKIDPSIAPTTSEEKTRFEAVVKHIALLQKEYKNLSVKKLESVTNLLKK